MVTVIGDHAVLSFSYEKYLPLGSPEIIVQNLDRWGADEILVMCIDRAIQGPNFQLIEKIASCGITTPLIYGGGVRTKNEAIEVIRSGADRIIINSGWHSHPEQVCKMHEVIGSQALLANIPVGLNGGEGFAYNYITKERGPVPEAILRSKEQGYVSEVVLTDYRSEGTDNGYDSRLLDCFPRFGDRLIAFGGIGTPDLAVDILSKPNCVAIGVGNYLNYTENAIQNYKKKLEVLGVRAPNYDQNITERIMYAADL